MMHHPSKMRVMDIESQFDSNSDRITQLRTVHRTNSTGLYPSQHQECTATPSTQSPRYVSEPPWVSISPMPLRSCKVELRMRPPRAYRSPCRASVVLIQYRDRDFSEQKRDDKAGINPEQTSNNLCASGFVDGTEQGTGREGRKGE